MHGWYEDVFVGLPDDFEKKYGVLNRSSFSRKIRFIHGNITG